MFNDLKTSSDFLAMYRREQKAAALPSGPSHCELEVSVLTSGFWPIVSDPPCSLPPEVRDVAGHFESYYLSKHSGRKLRWNTLKGSAELRATFGTAAAPRRHELSVSTYQMCALMQFNGAEEISYRALQTALGVSGDELKRHVMSLLNPKCRVLLKRASSAAGTSRGDGVAASVDLDDSDVLLVNADFSSKMVKVKIPLISMKSALSVSASVSGKVLSGGSAAVVGEADRDGAGDVPSQVEEARKHLLEAAIVRTMKTRKTVEHASLVAEVIKQVAMRFQPAPADIKKRIEGLIDRDYMERDKDSKHVYHYLA
jgi:cullin 3